MKDKVEIKFKFFAGNPHKGEWAGIHYYSPHIPAIFQQRGEIAAVLSLSGPANFDSSKAGNLLIDYLHETYFESDLESSLDALKNAVEKVKERLVEFMVNDEVSSEIGVEISLLAASIQENILYVAQLGEAKIFGYRNDELIELSEYLKDPSGKAQIKIGSTVLEKDDRLLLLTAETDFNLSTIEKKHVLEEFKLDPVEAKVFSNESLISSLLLGYEVKESYQQLEQENEEENISISAETREKSVEEDEQDEEFEKDIFIEENPEEQTIENVEDGNKIGEPQEKINNEKVNFKIDLNKVGNNLKRIRRDKRTKTFIFLLSSIGVAIFGLITKVLKIFWRDVLKMESGIYLKSASRKGMNWRPFVLLAVILVVCGFLIFNSIKNKKEAAQIELQNKLAIEKVENDIKMLTSEIDVLNKTVGKEEEKTQKLLELQSLKTELDSVSLEQYKTKKDELNQLAESYEDKIIRKIRINNPKVIKDFGIYEGSDPVDFTISGDRIFVADIEGGKLLSMDFEGGNIKSYGENLEKPKAIAIFEGRELVFVDENAERGVGTVNLETSQIERLPGLSKSRLGNINEMTIYKVAENDIRIYATREGTKELIQMRRVTNSFGLPELRLTRSDFTNLIDVDVDNGRIYVLSEGQGVRRFLGDNEFGNTVAGMLNGDNWSTADCMYVDSNYIYLGDSINKRVMVFTKSRGESPDTLDYIAQYDLSTFDGAQSIKDVMTDKIKNKLYVLLGTKLIELDLNQLNEYTY